MIVYSVSRAIRQLNILTNTLETVSFVSPRRSNARGKVEVEWKQNSLLPAGPLIKCFVIPPNSKWEKNAKKSFALSRLTDKFTVVSRSTICSCATCCLPQGVSKFCSPWRVSEFWPTAHESFSSNRKTYIWFGRYNKLSYLFGTSSIIYDRC